MKSNEFTAEQRLWLRAFPYGMLAIGVFLAGMITRTIGTTVVQAYTHVRVATIKADIVQTIVDGAVTIVQTIVSGVAP